MNHCRLSLLMLDFRADALGGRLLQFCFEFSFFHRAASLGQISLRVSSGDLTRVTASSCQQIPVDTVPAMTAEGGEEKARTQVRVSLAQLFDDIRSEDMGGCVRGLQLLSEGIFANGMCISPALDA